MSTKGERTRRAILEAAMVLLRERGPGHVSMAEVAVATGVTRQAVYLHFPSRTALMLALVDYVGEHLGARAIYGNASSAATARELLLERLGADARYAARVHDVANALDLARHSDDAALAAWDDRMALRRRDIARIVRQLESEGALRPTWSIARVVDALWALTAPRMYSDLVVERGWSLADYERFLVSTAQSFLVPVGTRRRTPSKPRRA